jgi:hypothetical protein
LPEGTPPWEFHWVLITWVRQQKLDQNAGIQPAKIVSQKNVPLNRKKWSEPMKKGN